MRGSNPRPRACEAAGAQPTSAEERVRATAWSILQLLAFTKVDQFEAEFVTAAYTFSAALRSDLRRAAVRTTELCADSVS